MKKLFFYLLIVGFMISDIPFSLAQEHTGNSILVEDSASEFVQSIDWNADGSMLAIGHIDGTVLVVDASGTTLATFQFDHPLNEVEWSPVDSNLFVVAAGAPGSEDFKGLVGLVDMNTATIVNTWDAEIQATSVSWNPTGESVAATIDKPHPLGGETISQINIWDISSYLLTKEIPKSFNTVSWSTNGNYLAGISPIQGGIVVWDIVNEQEIFTYFPEYYGLSDVEWNGDKLAFSLSSSGNETLVIWDSGTQESFILRDEEFNIGDLEWSPNGELIAIVEYQDEKKILVLDSTTGEVVQPYPNIQGANVSWSNDGSRLAFQRSDEVVIIFIEN